MPNYSKIARGLTSALRTEDATANAIGKAAQSAGQKAPVVANKPLTTNQDFYQSLGDAIQERVANRQNLIESLPYKYDAGHYVFTEDSARKNWPPMKILYRDLAGNKLMREDQNDPLSKVIKDEVTGKALRTPHEQGYKVRLEHAPDNWSEFLIPESAIKGMVSEAKGGAIRMQVGGLSRLAMLAKGTKNVAPATQHEAQLIKMLQEAPEMADVSRGLFKAEAPQLSGLIDKLKTPERQSILPMPNRWFTKPNENPHVQPLVEKVLSANNMTRDQFHSGAFVDPKTGKILDTQIHKDVGVAIDPITNRPVMTSGGLSGRESLPSGIGSLTDSNLLKQGKYIPNGGDPILDDIGFLATIEKSGMGHKYGLGTEYATPTMLRNTMGGDNPTLRPRSVGDVFGMGDVVGQIKTTSKGPVHDVYEKLFVAPKGSNVEGVKLHKANGGAIKMQVGGLSKLVKGLMPTARIGLPAPEIIVPSKLSNVQEAVRKMKGNYGARRVERAADEIPNLDKLYKEEALKQAFLGDNAKAVMTMNPKDFEKYAAPLDPRFMDANSTRYTTSGERLTYPDYMSEYLPNVGAFNDVPFLEINKKIQGLSIPPFISGHEGRHRNRVMANKGEEAGLVLLNPRTELREPFPRRSQEEYIEALKKELEMTGNKVVPEKNFEQKDIKRPAIDLPDIYAKGGAIHMQVGGLSALANIGKATKAGSKLSAAEMAALRASGLEVPGVHFADSLNPNDIMRMSEALGNAGAEGKTLNLTQADRSRVYGPNKGGTGFSGLQLTNPAHQQAGSTWGVGKKGHVSRLTNATNPDTIWSTFIGSPTQHMSNPVTVERMYEAHRKANPSAELVGKMNDSLNSAVNKKGNLVFPNGIDLSDPSSLNQAQTFDQRKLVAKALVMGGQKKGEQASRDAFKIIQEETDPLLMDSPTYAVGNRLFTIDKNSGLYRPDLNSAFPHITTGTDMGLLFEPAPVEHAIPGFVKQFANRLNKNGELQPMGHKDLTATTPSVFVDYKYLTDLQKEGYKDGGSAELPPFHDFDKIMQRKDGGTVNTFEQRLKNALEQHMAVGGMVDRHYADAGTVTAPTTQELENMADSQGAAFGFFPQMAKKSFQQQTPTMDRASEMLKTQVTKEWEQAGRPGGAKELALRIGALTAGQGGDLLNFAQTMIPSLYDEKPTSVLESGKKPPAPYRDTRELQRIPKFPMTGSPEIKQSMREKGMINEDEYPLFELAGAIGAPMALAKAPNAIKGGLQMVNESPALNKGAEYIGRGASLAQVPIRRPFTPATATVEATAPDLGQGTTYGFRQGLNDVLLENPKLGTGRNKIREGQGTFTNAKGELELNPLLAIDVPRAGNLGDTPNANLALRKQIGQMGVDLNQEAMAAHRFIPLMTNNVRDASSALIKTKEGLTADEVAELAKQLGGNMAVTHNPKLGGVVVFPFGEVKKGQIPRELLRAQQAAGKVLGDRGQVKFGVSDYGKDRAYMMASEGDYTKAGAQPMSKTQQAQREKMQGLEKFLFPDSRSGIPGQVKAAPVGGLQPWSVGRDYPTSIIGIGNENKTQYQPVNFSTGKEGSKYDKYLEAEAERAKMLDEFHRALVPRYR